MTVMIDKTSIIGCLWDFTCYYITEPADEQELKESMQY